MLNSEVKQRDENILDVTSVNGSGTVFTVDNAVMLKNACKYLFICPYSLLPTKTEITSIAPVYIAINGDLIPLQTYCGKDVLTDQIRSFRINQRGNIVLRLVYDSTQFKIASQRLICSIAYGASKRT